MATFLVTFLSNIACMGERAKRGEALCFFYLFICWLCDCLIKMLSLLCEIFHFFQQNPTEVLHVLTILSLVFFFFPLFFSFFFLLAFSPTPVIDAALAALGAVLDGVIIAAFPMVASMMTFPMCIMKASMKLNMPKMPKLGKKSTKTWEDGKDKFEGHLEEAEGHMEIVAATEEHPEEEMEAVGEATSLALAFLGATTPPGVVAFLWAFFCLIADKAGIEALSKFAESDDTTLIVFLVGLLWDGICGQFGKSNLKKNKFFCSLLFTYQLFFTYFF